LSKKLLKQEGISEISSTDYLMQKQIIEGAERRNNEQNNRQENIINKGRIVTMD
jgi:hypothetical protein